MGRWIPNIENVDELIKGKGTLISKAIEELQHRKDERILRKLTDKVGVVGFETNNYILCAKEYVFGWVVSCHKGLLELAVKTKKQLLMYIGKTDKFYAFNPADTLKNGTSNMRAGIEMINFDIRDGKNIEKVTDK